MLKKRAKVGYQEGNGQTQIAFIFSCPGSCEEKNKELVSGITGDNLKYYLEIGVKRMPGLFTSDNKRDYLITNATDTVFYGKQREADDSEITSKENIDRLCKELAEVEQIIAFGKKAQKAMKNVNKRRVKEGESPIKTYKCCHLSISGLNNSYNVPAKITDTAKRTKFRIRKAFKDTFVE